MCTSKDVNNHICCKYSLFYLQQQSTCISHQKMLSESTTEDICPNVCPLLAKKRKRRDEKIPQISTRIVSFSGGKSSPATHHHGNQVMSQVIFYTILGSETKTTFDVPILERKFAVTAQNNFVCKRIGPVPKNPTLLLLQEGTRQLELV